MKIEFVKLPWFKGTPIYFHKFFWNGGFCYTSYRFLCLSIRIYK